MKLHALINLYNDRMFLGACLESLLDVVDSIIVADGAYEMYFKEYKQFDPNAKPESTDGSLELIKYFRGLPDRQVLTNGYKCWPSQTAKRTALIEAVPDGDWFIIIDADEMLGGDPSEALEKIYESGCAVASTPLYNPGLHQDRIKREWHPRIFEKTQGMHYKGTHWHLRDHYGRIIELRYPVFWTDLMAFIHFKGFKNQNRLIPHANYMTSLAERGWLEPTDLGKVLMKDEP